MAAKANTKPGPSAADRNAVAEAFARVLRARGLAVRAELVAEEEPPAGDRATHRPRRGHEHH